jgi:hypothetical protein
VAGIIGIRTTYVWNPNWWQAWAAILQAFLSAGAVWAAVKLQDRSTERREKKEEIERWEAVALVARFSYETYVLATKRFTNGMDANAFAGLYEHGDFEPATKAIKDIRSPELGDLELLSCWLNFEKAWRAAHGRVEHLTGVVARARETGAAVDAQNHLGDRETTLFNRAAGVERRVAQLVGRAPKM